MENNNNNGRGIFYGVIGVATLVVAIIGATFAYFSATAVSNNGINLGTTTVTLQMTGEKRNFRTDMIPVDSDHERFKLYPGLLSETEITNKTKGPGTCTDNDGNAICGIYEFTITNPSETVSQTVYGRIDITSNGADGKTFSNLKYAVFKGGADAIETGAGFDVVTQKTNQSVTGTGVDDGEIIIAARTFGEVIDDEDWTGADGDDWSDWTEQTLAPGDGQTYTVLVWLEEAAEANIEEAGLLFTAEITFDTGTGTGVTGNLSLAS